MCLSLFVFLIFWCRGLKRTKLVPQWVHGSCGSWWDNADISWCNSVCPNIGQNQGNIIYSKSQQTVALSGLAICEDLGPQIADHPGPNHKETESSNPNPPTTLALYNSVSTSKTQHTNLLPNPNHPSTPFPNNPKPIPKLYKNPTQPLRSNPYSFQLSGEKKKKQRPSFPKPPQRPSASSKWRCPSEASGGAWCRRRLCQSSSTGAKRSEVGGMFFFFSVFILKKKVHG